jgi:D-3-phosphoglycerate dehydrogenase
VIITDSEFGDCSVESEVLSDHAQVTFAGARTADELISAAREADALLVQYASITSEILDSLTRVKVIVRYGSGVDNIDVEHARRRGVDVRNVANYCVEEVADHTAALVHAASRRVLLYNLAVKKGAWRPLDVPPPLPPQRDPVGIVGYGRIGSAVASRMVRAGHPVYVFDELAAESARNDGHGCASSLEELAAKVNHLTLHAPLVPETSGMLTHDVLDLLGDMGHVVNAARGALIVEADLLCWLDAAPFCTASLDVLCQEPPTQGTSKALAAHARVVMSPHVAYLSTESVPRLRRRAALLVRDGLGFDGVGA